MRIHTICIDSGIPLSIKQASEIYVKIPRSPVRDCPDIPFVSLAACDNGIFTNAAVKRNSLVPYCRNTSDEVKALPVCKVVARRVTKHITLCVFGAAAQMLIMQKIQIIKEVILCISSAFLNAICKHIIILAKQELYPCTKMQYFNHYTNFAENLATTCPGSESRRSLQTRRRDDKSRRTLPRRI